MLQSKLSAAARHRAGPQFGAACALFCVLALVACGGGGSGGSGANETPATATATADNFTVAWNGERRLAVLDNDSVSGGTLTLSVAAAPKNGSVNINAGVLSYTPQPGFFGADEFSYKLDVGNASSTALVKLVVEAEITLQGVVSDSPMANAKVQASVGGKTFMADADALGRYSLPIKSGNASDFVSLTGTGVGAQNKVVLTSFVGELSGLAAASKDGKLTAEQMPSLWLSHITAAQAGLMVQAGKTPTSNAELAAAALQVNSLAVADAAALVKLVVDAGVALPTGAANTRELLESATLLNSFNSARRVADPAQLDATRLSAFSDITPAVAPPVRAGVPTELIYANGLGGAAAKITSVQLRPDGTATVLDDEARTAKWQLEKNVLRLIFDTPIVGYGDLVDDPNGNTTIYDLVTTGVLFTDMGPNLGPYTLAAYKLLRHRFYTYGRPYGTKVDDPSVDLVRRYTANASPFTAADFTVGARIAGPFSASPVDPNNLPGGPVTQQSFRQDVMQITGPGTAKMERNGAAATWRVSEGALYVDVGPFAARYRKLGGGPLGEERWAMELLEGSGKATEIDEIMAVRISPVTLTANEWAKNWRGNITAEVGSAAFYALKSDGTWTLTSWDRNVAEPSQTGSRYWRQLSDGRLALVAGAAQCNPFLGDPACKQLQNRFWSVLGRSGKTLWVMEEGPYFASFQERGGFVGSWRLVALTDASTGP